MADHSMSIEEEQEKLLKEAVSNVKGYSFHMKRALDRQNLIEAMTHINPMLNELRTGALSPQKYYSLYMQAFDELTFLESFFNDEIKRGGRAEDIYETVQHATHIVPRIYLLITIGSIYMRSKQAPAKDILKDLVEMCKGVQHPTRGLFLRNYLSQIAKNKLPDKGNEYEGEGGDVRDSVEFIVQNFSEMVRLWVRMETKSIVKDKEKRDKERKELRVLVGYNLVRLSQLEGVDLELYQELFPRMIEIIVQSRDYIAQQYLMECVVQVFPDEFHLATLSLFLEACMSLHSAVDIKSIFTTMMDRLGNFIAHQRELKGDSLGKAVNRMPDLFAQFVKRAAAERPKIMHGAAFAQAQLSLIGLALKAFPNRQDKIEVIFASTAENFQSGNGIDKDASKVLKKLLLAPLEHNQTISQAFALSNFEALLSMMSAKTRTEVALSIAKMAVNYGDRITNVDDCTKLLTLINPLLVDQDDATSDMTLDDEDFLAEQHTVCRLVHLLESEDVDTLSKMYNLFRKSFGGGGERRMAHTLQSMIFAYLKLACRVFQEGNQGSVKVDKLFEHVLKMIEVLKGIQSQKEMAFKLYLQTGSAADKCESSDSSYEALTRAFELYEGDLSESKTQSTSLNLIVATLNALKNVSEENYETLSTKACQYSSKLLRKPDQCLAVLQCSHLFWNLARADDTQVLNCLQKSLKIVDSCMPGQHLLLLVNILNRYLYHFQTENQKIKVKHINHLLGVIENNKVPIADPDPAQKVAVEPGHATTEVFLENTQKYLGGIEKYQSSE